MQATAQQPKKARKNPLAAMAAEIVQANENAPAPKAEKAPRTKADPSMLLKVGKVFKPRTNHVDKDATDQGRNPQIANWDALEQYMDGHDHVATYSELVAALQSAAVFGGYKETDNSAKFIRARVRHGHLVPAK
jgi:hypothetical protein